MELILYDGTTTLNLADGVAFGVPYDEWTPNVARRRLDVLGGRSPYEPVAESIPLHARGATGAAALANVQILARMMDQAARWWRGDVGVTAVQLWYKPTGSTLGGYLKNSVVPNGRGGLVGLSPRVNDASNYEIPGLSLDILRVEGQWLFDAYDVDNYCLNSSFEVFASGNFANWAKFGTPTLTQVAPLFHGRYAARINATNGAHGIYQDITLTNGVQYTISVYTSVVSGLGARLGVFDYGGFSNPVLQDNLSIGLTQLKVQKTAASGGIRVAVYAAQIGSIFEVDAVMVEEGSVATEYHPNSDDVFVATVAETGNPNVLAADWSASGIAGNDCPVKLELDYLESLYITDDFVRDGAILYTTGETPSPVIIEAETLTSGTIPTQAVAAARGGVVRRLTPSTTTTKTISGPVTATAGRRFAAWVLINSVASSAVGYTIAVNYWGASGSFIVGQSEPIYVSADQFNNEPLYVFLGITTISQDGIIGCSVSFTPDATSATVLDIDFFVIMPVNETDSVVALRRYDFNTLSNNYTLTINPEAMVEPAPSVKAVGPAISLNLPYFGNAYLTQNGLTANVIPLLNQGGNYLYTDESGTEMDFELTATRKLAFLTPE